MRQTLRQRFFIGLMFIAASFSLVSNPVKAAGETAYLTPASGAAYTGNTFTLSVDGHVGQSWWFWVPIGASSVQGSISFPSGLLRITSINTAGSSFPSGNVTPNNSTGRIDFNNSTNSGSHMNTTVHLFSVTFQAIAPGNANVAFGNVQYNIGTASTTGGTYALTTPSPPPPTPSPSPSPTPTQKPPTPSTSPKPSSSITPAPTPSTTPTPEETPAPVEQSDGGLKIQSVKATATRRENSVTWQVSSAEVALKLTYGTSKSTQTAKGNVVKSEDGSYKTIFDNLKAGTLYYFTIKATTADNLKAATYSGTLTTRGYPVQLTIQQNNLLLPGAKVVIEGRSFVANKNAIVTTEVSDGSHEAIITPPNSDQSYTVSFAVAKKSVPQNSNPELQSFILNVTAVGSSSAINSSLILPIIGSIVVVVLVITSIIGVLLYRKRQQAVVNNSTIDGDLLSANYGTVAENYRANTPEPNLDMMVTAQQPLNTNLSQPEDKITTNDTVVQTGPPSYQAPEIDATTLPLPPNPETTPSASASELTSSGYTEVEQLSPEIAQIEAAQEQENAAQSDEPSAVYDASTGELDIIHHHSQQTELIAAPPERPSLTPDATEQPLPSLPPPIIKRQEAM